MTEPDDVVIVTGTIRARPDTLDEILTASLEHVRRSRSEPGCLSHAVYRDIEDANRLVFLERWANRSVLDDHFNVAASAEFVRTVARLAAEPPSMSIYEARRSQ